MDNNGSGNDKKLEALRRKLEATKTALAQQTVKVQKAKERLEAREFATVGEALVRYARQARDFRTMLQQVLPAAVGTVSEDKARFLKSRGWLQ